MDNKIRALENYHRADPSSSAASYSFSDLDNLIAFYNTRSLCALGGDPIRSPPLERHGNSCRRPTSSSGSD